MISIVPFLSAVTIAFLYVSEFLMAILSGGRLFQALMLLGMNENLYARVLARRLVYDSVWRVRKARAWWKCMSVNVMNGLHEKCQSVNQTSFLECEPTEVFLHGCYTLVSVQVLVNVSGTFILDGFECLDSGLLMRVPHGAAIFHGWSNQTLVNVTSDRRCGSMREITTNHVEHSDTI